jgi:hypothetical protein
MQVKTKITMMISQIMKMILRMTMIRIKTTMTTIMMMTITTTMIMTMMIMMTMTTMITVDEEVQETEISSATARVDLLPAAGVADLEVHVRDLSLVADLHQEEAVVDHLQDRVEEDHQVATLHEEVLLQ